MQWVRNAPLLTKPSKKVSLTGTSQLSRAFTKSVSTRLFFSTPFILNHNRRDMRKLTILVTALMTALLGSYVLTGCSTAPAEGKLQIMYSGNIRGNVAPCG